MPRRPDRRGFVLPTVLGVMLLLFLISLGLSQVARLRMKATVRQEEQQRAYFLARRGMAEAQRRLAEFWARGQARKAGADGRWQDLPAAGGALRFSAQDERGKLNINRITPYILNRVLEQTGLTGDRLQTAADSILDWIDRDGLPRSRGAEERYYLGLQPPYRQRNGFFLNPGELTLVRGLGPWLVFGRGPGDPDSPLPAGEGLWSLATCYSPGRKVDLNSAPLKVLMCLPGLGPEKARRLVEARRRNPFRGVHQAGAILGGDASQAMRWLTVSPGRVYTIVSQAVLHESRARSTIMAVVRIPRRGLPATLFWVDDLSRVWTGGGVSGQGGGR